MSDPSVASSSAQNNGQNDVAFSEAKVLLKKGMTLSSSQKSEEALAFIGKALELKPDYVDAWLIKGVVLGRLGKLEAAFRLPVLGRDYVLGMRPAERAHARPLIPYVGLITYFTSPELCLHGIPLLRFI